MVEKMQPIPRSLMPKNRGRAKYEKTRDDCMKVSGLIARGLGELEVRKVMGISQKRFQFLLRVISRLSSDETVVWGKFSAITEQSIRRLDEIARRALSGSMKVVKVEIENGREVRKEVEVPCEPDLRAALKAISEIQRINEKRVEVGQGLGIYKSSKEKEKEKGGDLFLGFFVQDSRVRMARDLGDEFPEAIETEVVNEVQIGVEGDSATQGDRLSVVEKTGVTGR